jgi:hypothetical protein
VLSQTATFWTTIANTIGSFGVGSLVTQYITNRQRRQEWAKDNKRQEWRELISTLSQSFHYLADYSPGHLRAIGGEQHKGLLQANSEARMAIESRIFVADQMRLANMLERWQLIAGEKDWSRRAEYWSSLHGSLIEAARKDLAIKERIRLGQRWFGS